MQAASYSSWRLCCASLYRFTGTSQRSCRRRWPSLVHSSTPEIDLSRGRKSQNSCTIFTRWQCH